MEAVENMQLFAIVHGSVFHGLQTELCPFVFPVRTSVDPNKIIKEDVLPLTTACEISLKYFFLYHQWVHHSRVILLYIDQKDTIYT